MQGLLPFTFPFIYFLKYLIAKVNDKSVENKKAHFKSIKNDLENKGRALIDKINKLN